MNEYQRVKHMEEVDVKSVQQPYYSMQEHCMLKPESTTTKLKDIFDASATTLVLEFRMTCL